MKKLNVEQLENVQGGIFWGTETTSCDPRGIYYDEFGNEYVTYYYKCEAYFIFWIKVSETCYSAYGC